jgi:WD40 repeat protein
VRPGGHQLELGPTHTSLPTSVAADGTLAAWGFADGTIIAIDTASGETWKFLGHRIHVPSLTLDAARARLLSTAGLELRVWPLRRSPLTLVSNVPCTVYNLARSPDQTRAAIDCYDGALRLWSFADGSIQELHHHSSVAYGVAWRRDQACSAGFDNRVICTSPDGKTQQIFSSAERIRWLTASPDHQRLVVALADGSLTEVGSNTTILYAHGSPAYRMAFSPDGQLLASGADDGTVMVYDFLERRVTSRLDAHTARVLSVAWRDRELWTSSADGTMLRWRYQDHDSVLIERTREPGAFRFLHPLKGGWTANIDSQIMLIKDTTSHTMFRFDLGRHVQQLGVSPDERYIAATIANEIIIVDLARNSVASLGIPSDGVGYVGFVSPELLAISSANGLFSVELNRLEYHNLSNLTN